MTTGDPPPQPPPFRFGVRKERIDWGALHGVDADAVVSEGLSLSWGEGK
jgi:hypothetical protein